MPRRLLDLGLRGFGEGVFGFRTPRKLGVPLKGALRNYVGVHIYIYIYTYIDVWVQGLGQRVSEYLACLCVGSD